MCMLSCLTHVQLFASLWTVAQQPPLSMGFPRQEYYPADLEKEMATHFSILA